MKRFLLPLWLILSFAATQQSRAWGPLGHRLVADVAWDHLTPEAKADVQALLGHESLGDVSSWADHYLVGNYQTFYWHFVNIPPEATSYDRDRDCLIQPRTTAGTRIDKWRDCIVERIGYNEQRLADSTLDNSDRAIALKFLVHLVGDEHQPLHTLGVGRGGNDITVRVWGSDECGQWGCNLHEVWDEKLIEHRNLDEAAWLKMLENEIAAKKIVPGNGNAADWAMESHDLGRLALVAPGTNIDEAYYERNIGTVNQRLEQGGLRLAQLINAAFKASPLTKQ
jgi:nuclease S1